MKYRLRLYLYLIFIISGFILFFSKAWVIGLIVLACFYLFFGFVLIAGIYFNLGNKKKFNFWISATLPYLLFRTEKTYCYMLKAACIMEFKKDYEKSIKYALKVNDNNLSTDDDRSHYYCLVACLYSELKDFDKAFEFFEKAKTTPHDVSKDKFLDQLEKDLYMDYENSKQ